ncbi:MAG TPA: tetratricopeptide repeat protein [Candidatus Polarisedimenticolia bacterium]|nr:tetratricopeptide repeat protein [Candidatus Polarisedimenticolia bacterium]
MSSQTLIVALTALLCLAVGTAAGWGAARLHRWWNRDETEVNEDFARLYSEGITHYMAGRRDEAIEELTRAAKLRTDVVGLYLILGDLYRAKGLFDRAIRVHSSLLRRQELTRSERAQAHASLGDDFKTAGLVDRAREAFDKALEYDPKNLVALQAQARFAIEERQWDRALELEEKLLRLDKTRKNRPLAFIYNEIGREHLRLDDERLAQRNFQKAIAVDDRTYPAHIFLGDIYYKEGRLKKAVEHWERVVDLEPRHLHLVFDRLEHAYGEMDMGRALEEVCRRVTERDAKDWRARVLLSRIETNRGDHESAAHELLEAARVHPRSLTVQQELWKLMLSNRIDRRRIQEYLDLVKGVNEFADPFVCSTCRYASLEYVWRCPQCFEWDTFTEHRPGSETWQ